MHAAMDIPTINQRLRIPQAAVEDIVDQIVANFHPLKIFLFGSYANGNPRSESDLDILVVMETPQREAEQAVQICQKIEYLFGLDLIVVKPQRLAQRLAFGDSFLKEIVESGKVLYEAPDA